MTIISTVNGAITVALVFAGLSNQAIGQSLKDKFSLGLYLRPAFTRGLTSKEPTVLADNSFLTAGLGVYGLIRVRQEAARIPFYYIKAEVGVSNRIGVFDVDGFGPVRITSSILDFSVTLPITLEVSDALKAYVGLGANLGYLVNSKLESDVGVPPSVRGSSLRPGLIVDVGFLVDDKSTAQLGIRALTEVTKYGYSEIGFYLGFGISRREK
ncbi:MAG: hypothetical protein SH819_06015 [Cytophagales bacterium]|nr:hypothetical protein [Cytophagales bacterium]